jgi:hypothetical protein
MSGASATALAAAGLPRLDSTIRTATPRWLPRLTRTISPRHESTIMPPGVSMSIANWTAAGGERGVCLEVEAGGTYIAGHTDGVAEVDRQGSSDALFPSVFCVADVHAGISLFPLYGGPLWLVPPVGGRRYALRRQVRGLGRSLCWWAKANSSSRFTTPSFS